MSSTITELERALKKSKTHIAARDSDSGVLIPVGQSSIEFGLALPEHNIDFINKCLVNNHTILARKGEEKCINSSDLIGMTTSKRVHVQINLKLIYIHRTRTGMQEHE